MANERDAATGNGFRLSLDTWAVLLAFALALAVRVGLLAKVPW
jgi:hypothetical protein